MTYTHDGHAIFDGDDMMIDDFRPRAGEIIVGVLNRSAELTAENAKLRAELTEAVRLLDSIREFACQMHDLLREDPPSDPEVTRRWGRIVDFVSKHRDTV